MTTTTARHVIHALDPDVADALRDRDDLGARPRVLVDDEGGSPLRCCLRRSRPGERVALVSYAPLRRWAAAVGADPGAYDEVGPIVIHAQRCAGHAGDGYPDELRDSPRVLRAYTWDGRIRDGRLVDSAAHAGPVLDELFGDPDVAVVHARAVEFGCFTFEVRRAS